MDSLPLLVLLGSVEFDTKTGSVDGDFRSATLFWSEEEEWEECDDNDEEEESAPRSTAASQSSRL